MVWDDVLFYVQLVAGLSIVPILLWRYRSFRWEFHDFATTCLSLIAILVLLYLSCMPSSGPGSVSLTYSGMRISSAASPPSMGRRFCWASWA
jgi:hypothetical protein